MNTPETRSVSTDFSGTISSTLRRAGLFIALLVVLLITAAIAPDFYKVSNLLNVSRQAAVLMIVSVGQLLVLLVGGVVLLVYGINATNSFSSDVSRFFTGSPTDKAVWMVMGGLVAILVGLVGTWRKGKPA